MPSTTHRVQPMRRNRVDRRPNQLQIEFVASISRSGGLDKDGDVLKDLKTQQEYWRSVQAKLDEYWQRYPFGCSPSKQREEDRLNVLILIRKLREGIVASRRKDGFALEVYEQSLRLSTIFESSVHVTSTLAYLISNFYLPTMTSLATAGGLSTILIILLHRISSSYPSQSAFRDQLLAFSSSILLRDSAQHIWISSLAVALRSCNYFRVELLTRPPHFLPLLDGTPSVRSRQTTDTSVAAMLILVDALRTKMRLQSWSIIRTAYHEMTCSESTDTGNWLTRSLLLQSSTPGLSQGSYEDWMKAKAKEGHVKAKDQTRRKWILCKPR